MKIIGPEVLNSIELQPLQQLAAEKVAISVCESEDVQRIIGSFDKVFDVSTGFSEDQWQQLCDKVRNILTQVGAPNLIITNILKKIWPVSFEIYKWMLCHDVDMDISISTKFCWTPRVSIDYEKTAKIMTESDTINIKQRFKLACFYCLEQEVRSLWELMSLSDKRYFFRRGNLKNAYLNPIVLYWVYYIQEAPIDYWEIKILNYTQLFKYAVDKGYFSASKFFFWKLKIQIRTRMISNSFTVYTRKMYNPNNIVKHSHFAIAYFLIEMCPNLSFLPSFFGLGMVLRYFLEWPLQKHFMAVCGRLRRQIWERLHGELLEAIFEKDLGGFKDYDYKKLFMDFWLRSPVDYKRYVNTTTKVGFRIFFKFVKKHFDFVFDENSFVQKAKFRAVVFQREVSEDVHSYEREDVDFFRFLVRERIITKTAIEIFTNDPFRSNPFENFEMSFKTLPLGEVMYLIDGIL